MQRRLHRVRLGMHWDTITGEVPPLLLPKRIGTKHGSRSPCCPWPPAAAAELHTVAAAGITERGIVRATEIAERVVEHAAA